MRRYSPLILERMRQISMVARVAQVIDVHNASGGMWAFSEGLETMFFVVLLYLLRPVIFNLVSRVTARTASPKAS